MNKIKATILALKDLGKQDIANFKDWVWKIRHLNMFEPKVLSAPRTVMCKCYTDEEALLYMPLQPVLMFDALAPKPGLTPRQEALCLLRMCDKIEEVAKITGFQELYFICRDDRVSNLCAAHGFTEIPAVRVLKKTVSFQSAEQEPKEVACTLQPA